jgi:hypothetical protein
MLTRPVPRPKANEINGGLTSCKQATLIELLGRPRADYSTDCQPVTNTSLKAMMVIEDVGPFRVTGLKPAVDSLRRVFAAVKKKRPDLYDAVGSMGMLCCRNVRGSRTAISNHSWGTAIDLTFDGKLDLRGDGMCQAGLLDIYQFFRAEGWFWGAEFNTEDSMHFELADATARNLIGAYLKERKR